MNMKHLQFFSTSGYNKSLNYGSPSKIIAHKRNQVYNQVMVNMENAKKRASQLGLFSGSVEMSSATLATSLKEASLKAYLDSFAGYIALESSLNTMNELLSYYDMITKGTGAVVLPNIGVQTPRSGSQESTSHTIPVSTKTGSIDFGNAVLPGTVKVSAIINGAKVEISDDRKGNLIAPGGVLKSGSINYNTGKFDYETVEDPIAGDKLVIKYSIDALATDTDKRIKAVQRHYMINAYPNVFDYEFNIISSAINSKSDLTELSVVMSQAVQDEHQSSINNELVKSIRTNYAGTTLTMDLSAYSVAAGKFDSLIRTFQSGLTSVDSAIAKKCYKAVKATAYIVGLGLADVFSSMNDNEQWVPNNTGYVNGLIGFYKGRAVLTHTYCDDFEGFAIVKDPNGMVAPTALGIYLPANDLPLVGNFNNLSEVAGGIYSIEGVSFLTSDLVQRFAVNLPSDWMIVS